MAEIWSAATTSPCTTAVLLVGTYTAWRAIASWRALSHIPTVNGSDLPVLSWIGAFRFLFNAKAITREAYAKHKGGIFKVADLDKWRVVLCNPALVDEVRRLPDDTLSFSTAVDQFLQTEFMLSRRVVYDTYHIDMVKTVLPKKLDSIFPAIHEEVVAAFDDGLHTVGKEWVTVDPREITRFVICRASNRMLVGLPLCRDAQWVKDNVAFATVWILYATVLRLFPRFLKSVLARIINPISQNIARAREALIPTLEYTKKALAELEPGHPDRPDTFLAWMLENTKEDPTRTEPQALIEWIKAMNFASIETTNMSFMHILFDLAAHPEVVEPLRDEIQSVVNKRGWTKAAMSELVKLDSFMRESARMNIISLAVGRACLKEHTFLNGFTVPRGTIVEFNTAMMEDEDVCKDANEFMPFRYVTEDSSSGPKQFTSIGVDYLTFGIGRHACPGRFFAALEIKAMLSHFVMSYDVKTETPGVRPKNVGFGSQEMPSRSAKISIRKRQV